MIRSVLIQLLEEVLEALASEDSIEAYGYIEKLREVLDEFSLAANEIPEEVRCT